MAFRVSLYKLGEGHDVDAIVATLAASLRAEGYDADVGRPTDPAAQASWDLAVVARSTLAPSAERLDVAARLPAGSIVVGKTWVFG